MTVYCCVFADLNEQGDQKYDALLMSNVVPMYPEFKSKLLLISRQQLQAYIRNSDFFPFNFRFTFLF